MKKMLLSLTLCVSCFSLAIAQTNPAITQWLQNGTITGSHYEEGNPTPIDNGILANVQSVHYDTQYAYITTTGIPAYVTGPYLDGNIDVADDVAAIYQIPLEGTASNAETETSIGNNGVFINGVSLWDWQDTVSWDEAEETICGGPTEINCSSDSGPGGGGPGGGPGGNTGGTTTTTTTVEWNRDAVPAELEGFDCSKGHPANGNYHHHQNPTAFDLDLVELSNICDAYPADGLYAIDPTVHSSIIGFAFDGFPVYGPYAYEGVDGTGAIVRMKSSYAVDPNATTRVDGPDIDEVFVYQNARLGEVTEVFFNGYFKEDYIYTENTATDYLDDHNGRFCVTPEYPNGTYAYFATVNEDYNSVFPYLIGPTFYGEVLGTTVTSIPSDAILYDSTLNTTVFDENRLNLSVYPNPAQDFIAIQSSSIQRTTLKVDLVNQLGQVVLTDEILQGSTLSIIETHTLYNGIYFVRVSGGDATKTYKIIINK